VLRVDIVEEEAYKELFAFLANNTYPEGSTKNSKRRLREKAKSFFVCDNAVFHREWKGKEQRVVRREKVAELLQQMHSSPLRNKCDPAKDGGAFLVGDHERR